MKQIVISRNYMVTVEIAQWLTAKGIERDSSASEVLRELVNEAIKKENETNGKIQQSEA